MKTGVVIPAAGSGKRMEREENKVFLSLLGRPVLVYTLSLFWGHRDIHQLVLVGKEEELERYHSLVEEYFGAETGIRIVAGGDSRQESVFSGLENLDGGTDYVLIHDGARPLLSPRLRDAIMSEVRKKKAVVPALPLKETVKEVNERGIVRRTVPRHSLRAVQTPQAFSFSLLYRAYHQGLISGRMMTDDASFVEREMNFKIQIIPGCEENIKLTTPHDLLLAEAILRARGEKE